MSEEADDAPPPRASAPKRRREGIVIEGEAIVNAMPLRRAFAPRDFAAAGLGALLALAAAGLLTTAPNWRATLPIFAPVAAEPAGLGALKDELDRRDAETARRQDAVLQAIRAQGLALEQRLAALEGSAARADALASEAKAAGQAARAVAADPRLDKLAAEIAALRADLARAQARLDALAPGADRARAGAIADLRERLDAGEPLGPPLAALERLGVDPTALGALRPFAATPPPTHAALARSLNDAAARIDAASDSEPSAAGRAWAALRGLVKSRKVGESRGAQAGIVARAQGALAHDDLAGALAAMRDLAPPAQGAAQAWTRAAETRLAAERSADALTRDSAGR